MTGLLIAVREAMIWGGASLVAYGAYSAYRPAGLIVAGVFLFSSGAVGAMRSRPRNEERAE